MSDASSRLASALSRSYRIERELGQGGMATVYLAHDLKHDRQVAIKVLRPELASVLGAERFLQEIRLTARLRHPHILPLYDSGAVDGTLFYVTPLVEGGSLKDRLARDGRLPATEAIRIAREVADALAYAHQHDVIHRDIKPDNILLESGHATVADFGIARAITAAGADRLTETGLAIGTPAYMSPEQASGDTEIDRRADIYALGTVLYEMLAGEPPFAGPTLQAMMAAVLTRAPAPLPIGGALSPALAAAVARAMAKVSLRAFCDRRRIRRVRSAVAHQESDAARRQAAQDLRWSSRRLAVLSLIAVIVWCWAIAARRPGSPWRQAGTADFQRGGRGVAGLVSRRTAARLLPHGKRLPQPVRETVSNPGEERQLTRGSRDDIQAAWSPDGKVIALVRSSMSNGRLEPGDVLGWYADGGDVWTIDPKSGRETQLLSNAFNPSWSPDGSHLAVDAAIGGPHRIWITDANGRNLGKSPATARRWWCTCHRAGRPTASTWSSAAFSSRNPTWRSWTLPRERPGGSPTTTWWTSIPPGHHPDAISTSPLPAVEDSTSGECGSHPPALRRRPRSS